MKTLIFLFLLLISIKTYPQELNVLAGADILISENLDLLKGRSIGIISNQTGVLKNGTHIADTLMNISGIKVKALFGPEHGFKGNTADGAILNDTTDETGVKVFSLYGKIRKPTPKMLKGVDLLIFDMQSVGVRFYTFISTMYYSLEAAAENNIPILVLDRPNPIGGVKVDGPVVAKGLESFVGIAPIPIQYGMTIGELAQLFNEEKMLNNGVKANLTVIKLKNWKREYFYDNTGLNWIPTSPNIPNLETAIVYPGACLLEGTNISEGRGTDSPFLLFGAPYINSNKIIAELNSSNILGAEFKEQKFIPVEIPGKALNPKYENEECNGIKIKLTNRNEFKAVEFGVKLISIISKNYPDDFKWRHSIERLFGKKYLREMILQNKEAEVIISKWKDEVNQFKLLRNKYLLY